MNVSQNNGTCIKYVNFKFAEIFLPTVYVLVFVFGLLGNCFGLKSVVDKWIKLGKTNVFFLNLCIADILYLFTLPFLVAYYAYEQKWTFGQPLCKITRFLFSINLYGSIGFLTLISVYRYLGIVHPLKAKGRISVRYTVGITVLVWNLVVIQSLPEVYFEKSRPNYTECFDTTVNSSMNLYLTLSIARTVTGFVIPFMIIICCYGHVAVTLAFKKDSGDPMLNLRCLRQVVILALLFSICYIPYHIFRNLNLQTRIWKMTGCEEWYASIYIANQISNGMACLNSAINPLVYLFNSDELLIKCFKCIKVHPFPDVSNSSPLYSPRRVKESVKPPIKR